MLRLAASCGISSLTWRPSQMAGLLCIHLPCSRMKLAEPRRYADPERWLKVERGFIAGGEIDNRLSQAARTDLLSARLAPVTHQEEALGLPRGGVRLRWPAAAPRTPSAFCDYVWSCPEFPAQHKPDLWCNGRAPPRCCRSKGKFYQQRAFNGLADGSFLLRRERSCGLNRRVRSLFAGSSVGSR
jgi:hypothetical protein